MFGTNRVSDSALTHVISIIGNKICVTPNLFFLLKFPHLLGLLAELIKSKLGLAPRIYHGKELFIEFIGNRTLTFIAFFIFGGFCHLVLLLHFWLPFSLLLVLGLGGRALPLRLSLPDDISLRSTTLDLFDGIVIRFISFLHLIFNVFILALVVFLFFSAVVPEHNFLSLWDIIEANLEANTANFFTKLGLALALAPLFLFLRGTSASGRWCREPGIVMIVLRDVGGLLMHTHGLSLWLALLLAPPFAASRPCGHCGFDKDGTSRCPLSLVV